MGSKKTQRGISNVEYIVMLAAVLIIILLASIFLRSVPEAAAESKMQHSTDYWTRQAAPFRITEHQQGILEAGGSQLLVAMLQNTGGGKVFINRIEIDGKEMPIANPNKQDGTIAVGAGEKQKVILVDPNPPSCPAGQYYEHNVKITYKDGMGNVLDQVGDVKIYGKCTPPDASDCTLCNTHGEPNLLCCAPYACVPDEVYPEYSTCVVCGNSQPDRENFGETCANCPQDFGCAICNPCDPQTGDCRPATEGDMCDPAIPNCCQPPSDCYELEQDFWVCQACANLGQLCDSAGRCCQTPGVPVIGCDVVQGMGANERCCIPSGETGCRIGEHDCCLTQICMQDGAQTRCVGEEDVPDYVSTIFASSIPPYMNVSTYYNIEGEVRNAGRQTAPLLDNTTNPNFPLSPYPNCGAAFASNESGILTKITSYEIPELLTNIGVPVSHNTSCTAPGQTTILLVADTCNGLGEINESNNIAMANVTCIQPQPDLAPTINESAYNMTFATGQKVTISFNTTNTGNLTSNISVTNVTFNGADVNVSRLPPLAPGSAFQHLFNITCPATGGNYSLNITVDYGNNNSEWDEGNNKRSFNISCLCLPDLEIFLTSPWPSEIPTMMPEINYSNMIRAANWSIRNRGNCPSAAPPPNESCYCSSGVPPHLSCPCDVEKEPHFWPNGTFMPNWSFIRMYQYYDNSYPLSCVVLGCGLISWSMDDHHPAGPGYSFDGFPLPSLAPGQGLNYSWGSMCYGGDWSWWSPGKQIHTVISVAARHYQQESNYSNNYIFANSTCCAVADAPCSGGGDCCTGLHCVSGICSPAPDIVANGSIPMLSGYKALDIPFDVTVSTTNNGTVAAINWSTTTVTFGESTIANISIRPLASGEGNTTNVTINCSSIGTVDFRVIADAAGNVSEGKNERNNEWHYPVNCFAGTPYSSISAGAFHTCGIRANDSHGLCWGHNSWGQLGDGTRVEKHNPTPTSDHSEYTSISAGGFFSADHTCGIRTSDSLVLCWGRGEYGQLGYGSMWDKSTPTLTSDPSEYTRVSAGGAHTCGINASNGRVLCWGYGDYGELGYGGTGNKRNPFPTSDLSEYASISAGAYHTCGINATGRVLCWGRNANGSLGDGSTTQRLIPTPTSDPSEYASISAGAYHTCGIRANDSRVLCWGQGANGQIGDGSTTQRLTPTLTSDPSEYTSISAGGYHTCGIRAIDGIVLCWGGNGQGQLGDGSTSPRLEPTPTSDPSPYTHISAGKLHTCGIRASDSRGLCWGDNDNGRLGDGSTTWRLVPTLVTEPS